MSRQSGNGLKELKEFLLAYAVFLVFCPPIGWVMYLVSTAEPISAKEWLLSGIPAWLQGLGTVGAAWFAWRAYGTWRDQETWRRRASAAESILREAHALAESIRDIRVRRESKRVRPSVEDLAAVSEMTVKRGDLDAARLKVKNLEFTAKHYKYGRRVSGGLSSLTELAKRMTEAHRNVARYSAQKFSHIDLSALPQEQGTQLEKDYTLVSKQTGHDDVERELTSSLEALEFGLSEYVEARQRFQ